MDKIRPASRDELSKLTAAMPEPYQPMILLASWCALRFGELTELRRRDIDFEERVIRVRRAVVRVGGEFQVTTPKSEAGSRDVAIPPHLLGALADHLIDRVDAGPDALLFAAKGGGHLAPASLYRRFYTAREAAGRPDLRLHDKVLRTAIEAYDGGSVASPGGERRYSARCFGWFACCVDA